MSICLYTIGHVVFLTIFSPKSSWTVALTVAKSLGAYSLPATLAGTAFNHSTGWFSVALLKKLRDGW